jgi:hypothetical protein
VFEYRTVIRVFDQKTSDDEINLLGADGWELISTNVIVSNNQVIEYLYFCRLTSDSIFLETSTQKGFSVN